MKRFVVVGLGRFGSRIAKALYAEGFEVVAIDLDEARVDRFANEVTRAVAADGTEPDVLTEVGADDADAAILSTGEDLAATMLGTQALQALGVEEIYVKVSSERAARAMRRFGVTETIFPEREVAERLARRLESATVLDYVRIGEEYSVQEMAVPSDWVGKTLAELDLAVEKGLQVIALRQPHSRDWRVVPDPHEPIQADDLAIVAGSDETIHELTAKAEEDNAEE